MCVNFLLTSFFFYYITFGEASLIVETKNGLVMGKEAQTVPGNITYHAFQGIPYAQPPLGDLRFASPLPAKNWTGTLDATQDGNICPQSYTQGSEDCLFINVYTTNFDSTKKIPVMFYIYGGGFFTGDSQYATYGPDYFLLQGDILIVTFNYRLGIFGFLSTEDQAASANCGIKDQILALKWVQDNIANFGGDSNMVTIFGESAGAASVSYLCQTDQTQGLFHKAIMQSGTSLDLWALTRNPRENAFATGRLLGIFTNNSTELVRRLRQIDVSLLNTIGTTEYITEFVVINPLKGFFFGPCLESQSDGAVIVEKSHELLENGGFHEIPYIIGFTSQESLSFVTVIIWLNVYLLANGLNPTELIPVDMKVNGFTQVTVAAQIRTHYFGPLPIIYSQPGIRQFLTDQQFVNAIHEAVRLISLSTTVYCYRFSYEGPTGNAGQPRTAPGVGHAEDSQYFWRKQNPVVVPTANDVLTSQRLLKMWTNFAKTSNPTPVPDPLLQSITWSASSSQDVSYLDIGNNLAMSDNFTQYSTAFWNGLYATYGHPPFDTY